MGCVYACGTWQSTVNSNCFPNSETIAISMATNVTVSDVCMTQE